MWTAAAVLAGSSGSVVAQQTPPPSDPPPQHVWIDMPMPRLNESTRHFRVGALLGINVKAQFKMSGQFSVSGANPGEPGVSGVDHLYDDGYVLVDDTGNALGLTSYWGYQSASQFDPVAQTLTFHSAKSFSASGGAKSDDSPYLGLDVAYGAKPWRMGRTQIGWEFGFGYLPIKIKDNQPVTADINRTVHAFSTGGILPPAAPYNGDPGGIGPVISDVATALADDATAGTITGSRTLDTTLFLIRLGPLLHWELHPRWAVSLGVGGAAGYLDGDLRFDERVVSADGGSGQNSGRVEGSEFVFGGYVGATLMFHAEKHGDFYVGAQYMPLGSATISGSGREARLDLSGGVYFTAGVNWPF
ncbi:MAG: hypothetical protein KJ070_16600 [Verrucomicrobia bacterium]|nr:hypothetical protein [Verrucomicrobiota bacterium]